RTCRAVSPEAITKKSVITISSRTSRIVMSAPCFSAAAWAAATATSRLSGSRPSVGVTKFQASRPSRALEVLSHQERDVREPGSLPDHDNAPDAEQRMELVGGRLRVGPL